jgi:hypothetical protein
VQSPPALQLSPGPQALRHAPQWAVVSSDCSQPFAAEPSQSPKPAAHVPKPHIPMTQVRPFAFRTRVLQSTVQLPHEVNAEEVAASQPFVRSPSQSAKPASHAV